MFSIPRFLVSSAYDGDAMAFVQMVRLSFVHCYYTSYLIRPIQIWFVSQRVVVGRTGYKVRISSFVGETFVVHTPNRFVLADTDKLHQKLAEMSRRIRQLEDALQVEYGSRSTETHPLLSDDLLTVKGGIDHKGRGHVADSEGGESESRNDLTDESYTGAMGLLTISEGGAVRFLGATGIEVSGQLRVRLRGLK